MLTPHSVPDGGASCTKRIDTPAAAIFADLQKMTAFDLA
jgi:hypothetical protein